MSVVILDYDEIESAAKQARKAVDDIDDYIDVINCRILSKIDALSGSDDMGYMAAARSAAAAKAGQLEEKKASFTLLSTDVELFIEQAKETDKIVANRIEQLAEPYKRKATFMGVVGMVGDWLYNVFCVEGGSFLPAAFAGTIRNLWKETGHVLEDVRDWFKHGAGQYVKNMLDSVGDVLGAILVVGGAALLAVTNGFALLAMAAVILGGIYIIGQMGNTMAALDDNMEALRLHRNGQKALAHYYGGTEGVAGWVDKRDFGDSRDNMHLENAAIIYDGVVKSAKTGVSIVALAAGIGSVTVVRGQGRNVIAGHELNLKTLDKNITKKWRETVSEMGIDRIGQGSGRPVIHKLNIKKFLLNGPEDKISKLTGKDSLDRTKTLISLGSGMLDYLSEGTELSGNLDTLADGEKNTYDKVKALIDIVDVGGLSEFSGDYLDGVLDVWGDCDDLSQMPGEHSLPDFIKKLEKVHAYEPEPSGAG